MKKLFINILEKNKELFLYLLPVSAIFLPWAFKEGYVFMADFVWGPKAFWDISNTAFFSSLFMKILSGFYFFDIGEKIYFTLTLLVVLMGGRKIVRNFTDNKTLIFIISLFFLFNPFIYDRVMYGQINIVAFFGFLCLAVGYLLEFLRTKENKKILFFGILSGISAQFSPHSIFFSVAMYVIFLFIVFMGKKEFNVREFIKYGILAFLIVISINFNWIFGVFLGEPSAPKMVDFVNLGISEEDLIAFQTSGKNGFDALKNTVMMSGFWGKDQFRYVDLTKQKENWGRSFYLLLPLIIWGAVMGLRKKEFRVLTIGLLILFAGVVVLAVGIRLPVAKEITLWLFNNFPFYKGLRETQKWAALVVMVYGIFLAMGVNELFKKKIIQNYKFLSGFVFGSVIIMQAPLMLWGLGGQIRPVDYPKDWYEIDNLIVNKFQLSISDFQQKFINGKKGCDSNVLFLPWHMHMHFKWVGNIVAVPANVFFSCPVIQGTNMEWGGIYDNSTDLKGQKVFEWLSARGQTDLLNNADLNIKYIILAKEVDWQGYLWINSLPDVEFIKETETLRLYRIKK